MIESSVKEDDNSCHYRKHSLNSSDMRIKAFRDIKDGRIGKTEVKVID